MDSAEEAAREASRENDKLLDVDLHEDRTKEFKSPSFTRMQTDWDGPNGEIVRDMRQVADDYILAKFTDAYQLLNEVYDAVRVCQVDANGEIVRDRNGFKVWKKDEYGAYVEEWKNLGIREREQLVLRIAAYLVEWEQEAANIWAEAMWAKANFEEAFAKHFLSASDKTVDAKNQVGRIGARQERYWGICRSLMSRKADALVNSMKLIDQRLKDTMG